MNPEERSRAQLETHPDQLATSIKAVFEHPKADVLLTWLMDVCSATQTPFDEDPLTMAAAVGRQQVWFALNTILSMDGRDIAACREAVAAWENDIV